MSNIGRIAKLAGNLSPHEAQALVGAMQRIAEGVPAETALAGLRSLPGQRSVETVSRIAERDELIRQAYKQFYRGMSANAASQPLAAALARYRSDRWPRKRTAVSNPEPAGSREATWWAVLKNWDRLLSGHRVKTVLLAGARAGRY